MAKNDISNENKTYLQNKPWKVWMSIAPQPSAVLVSLYDLIFKQGESDPVLYFDNSDETREKYTTLRLYGLEHNIIIYDTALYELSGSLIGSVNKEVFYEEGIEVSNPKYDKRAKKRIVTSEINGTPIDFYLPDKDSVIYPETAEELYNSYGRSASAVPTCNSVIAASVGALYDSTAASASSFTFILASPDTVFDSTLVLEPTKKSYTQMCLNLYNKKSSGEKTLDTWKIINDTLRSISPSVTEEFNFFNDPDPSVNTTEFLSWVKDPDTNAKDILQHTYIWIKAAFAADYIDPKDFNQDLNQKANVIHRNVYSHSFREDYNRYNETATETSANTRGYIPKNAPLKDLISDDLYKAEVSDWDNLPTVAKKVKKLEDVSSLDGTNIGGVISEPIKMDSTEATYGDNVVPPQFFDSEARYNSDEEREKLGRVPVGLPKYGNIYTDGRIISPTVDELWYMVKKLISGRSADTTVNPVTEDFGVLKGKDERANDADTSIIEVNSPFKFTVGEVEKEGDPVNFELELDEQQDIKALNITEFFSQPNVALYHNFIDLSADSEYYKTFGTANKVVINSGNVEAGKTPTFTNIQIENISENIGVPDTFWDVRKDPLSLRELEGRTLSLKYNLVKVYRDITKNFTMVGPLGKKFIYTDPVLKTEEVSSAGGLYQLHRDYNFDSANPNTWFHMNGDKTGNPTTGGIDAEFGDLENSESISEEGLKLYNSEKEKTSKKPLLKENYGMSRTLSEDDSEYYGSDVYLAADGTWRYRAEHMRFPILRSQF